MKKIELLAPAGNAEKLKTAFYFGADACYFAGKKFGLRAFADNFTDQELEEYVKYAHSLGKKAYINVNIIAHNSDFDGLKEYLEFLVKIKADAVIVADIGIACYVKKYAPSLDLHISTQANITNVHSALFFKELGAKRLILARELSIKEISEIANAVGPEVEIEVFVHGAMCISYSGRCLLSNYLTGRDSNRGACAQACRWNYSIVEKKRPSQHYDIQEDERGTYIMNSRDLNMIEHLDKLIEAGVTSFKIEGRMKSPNYVATVVNAYRRAINSIKSEQPYNPTEELKFELLKASHREYTTGFYFGNAKQGEVNLDNPQATQISEFIALVVEDTKNGLTLVEMRNRFKVGDTLEILSPNENFNKTVTITKIINQKGEEISDAKNVQEKLYIQTELKLYKNDILRSYVKQN